VKTMSSVLSLPLSVWHTETAESFVTFRGKLVYAADSRVVLSANEDACAFFGCPSAALTGQRITDLPWPKASVVAAGGMEPSALLSEQFDATCYKRTIWLLERTSAAGDVWLGVETEPLPLGDRLVMLVSLSFERPRTSAPVEERIPVSWTGLNLTDNEPSAPARGTQCLPAEEAQNYIMRFARCLLWHAEVHQDEDGLLHWIAAPLDEQAAQEFLPLEIAPDQTYWEALAQSRLEEDTAGTESLSRQSLLADRDYSQEFRQRNRYGEIRWLHEDVHVELVGPGRWRCIGVCTDITELKRAQEVHQYVARSARCFLWYADVSEFEPPLETRLHWDIHPITNETGQDFIPLEQCPGQSYLAAMYYSRKLANEDLTRLHRCGTDSLRANRDFSQEFRVFDKYGGIHWLREDVRVEPVAPDRWRCVGVCTDITEQKRLQAQVIRSERLAAMGELVAGVVHEINNPLAAISGYAQLMAKHSEPQVQADAQGILRMSERAARIVHSLLTFARKDGAQERYRTPLRPLVEGILDVLRYKLCKAEIQVEFRPVEPDLCPWINAGEIEQVLMNLVSNAEYALRGHSREKRLLIDTQQRQDEQGNRWVAISVSDNGSGIPADVMPHLFEPFFTTKPTGDGTGLGLAICHGIAESHGGHLTAHSTDGNGATFVLMLPLHDVASER
jgi:signal transduction histidine kinase